MRVVVSMGFSNSSLVSYTNLTKNKTTNRNQPITRITPHCFVGQVSAKRGCDYFAETSREASCNYVIGFDGKIGLSVEEKDRSWCSSSSANDNRAITFEIASDTVHPYKITDAALNACIALCIDICKRYNKKKLVWIENQSQALAYSVKSDELLITVHRWFANKACPGAYIMGKISYIVETVNNELNGVENTMTESELKAFVEKTVREMGAGQPASTWAAPLVEEAKEMGITDGSNPQGLATRQEVAIMAMRAAQIKQ